MSPCQHCIRVHFRRALASQSKTVFSHWASHRVAPISTLRTHSTSISATGELSTFFWRWWRSVLKGNGFLGCCNARWKLWTQGHPVPPETVVAKGIGRRRRSKDAREEQQQGKRRIRGTTCGEADLFSTTRAEGQRQGVHFRVSNTGPGSWRTASSAKMIAQEVLFFEVLCGHLDGGK